MKYSRVSILLFITILLAGCKYLSAEYKTVSCKNTSIELPHTWELTLDTILDTSGQAIRYTSPAGNSIDVNVFGNVWDKEQIIDHYKMQIENTYSKFYKAEFSEVEETEFHGMDALECKYKGGVPGMMYRAKIIVFNDEQSTYSILLFDQNTLLKNVHANRILNSFKIIEN